jgi:hypothetical protein
VDHGAVIFVPSTAAKARDTDFAIDGLKQVNALRRADPKRDAEKAFRARDFRLVAD